MAGWIQRIVAILTVASAGWPAGADAPPEPLGSCCMDVSDGPVPYETCVVLDESACDREGGVPGAAGSECTQGVACCLGFAGERLCVEIDPFCCALSGGVSLGPHATCAEVQANGGCGSVCGGIAWIPCPDGEFCRLGVGTCCCDFQGICMPFPDACPAVVDPVCGCDGVTYVNSCEADAAGMSIDHVGFCLLDRGDFDGDGDVDRDDYAHFAVCMNRPNEPPDLPNAIVVQRCLDVFDFDVDADVDLRDFAVLVLVMDGI